MESRKRRLEKSVTTLANKALMESRKPPVRVELSNALKMRISFDVTKIQSKRTKVQQ